MKKRHYSKEFKEQAVRLSYQRDNIKELANELGVAAERIYKWRKVSRDVLLANNTPLIEKQEFSEINRLKRALKDKELELEILKKAVHIFSKSDGRSINL